MDHFPLKARLQVKLKGCRKHDKTKPKYTECTEAQSRQLNDSIQQLCAPSGVARQTPNLNTQILQQLTRTLPRQKAKARLTAFSEATKQILEERQTSVINRDPVTYELLTKRFRKSKQRDRKDYIIKTSSKDLDVKDRWMGIRQLKSTYNPQPYHRRTQKGQHIRLEQRAQMAAQYSGSQQWGRTAQQEENGMQLENDNIVGHMEAYDTAEITVEEFMRICK